MDRVLNRIQTKRRRQYLRNNMTRAEKVLWTKLRGSRLSGLKFRRQCGIGRYIVDFYCPKIKLAIEIDGDVHGYQSTRQKDLAKERFLEGLGVHVLRFTNGDILESMGGVLRMILSNHPLTPSLSKEGE